MKNWTWKQWTAVGVIAAVVIAAVVCHLVQPQVTYAWLEMVAGGTFVLGALVGSWLCKNKPCEKTKE
jgi:peptidoglycan/LPS O-acetylase OafA/YrhL